MSSNLLRSVAGQPEVTNVRDSDHSTAIVRDCTEDEC
jgi:hypothetical protein